MNKHYIYIYVHTHTLSFIITEMASGVPRSCRDGEECEPLRHPGVLEQNPVAGQSKKQGFCSEFVL